MPPRVYVAPQFMHPKNDHGLHLLHAAGCIRRTEDPCEADVAIVPTSPMDLSLLPPHAHVIYGPHFSVFPDANYDDLQPHARHVYAQPSDWVAHMWKTLRPNGAVPLVVLPYPVDVQRFAPKRSRSERDPRACFVYAKMRAPQEVHCMMCALISFGFRPTLFDYMQRYDEAEYLAALQRSAFGVWIGCPESQGFALEEALACDVPLFVWDAEHMSQTYGHEHEYAWVPVPATSAPYWDGRCGVRATYPEALRDFLELMHMRPSDFAPRAYVLEHLSAEAVFETYWKPVLKIK